MRAGLDGALAERLRSVAVEVAVGRGRGLDDAIALAEHLVSSGLGDSATLQVASLSRGSVRSDAEPSVRNMLAEFGVDVPSVKDEAARYSLLLVAFGHWDLPFELWRGPGARDAR